ncbi:MAG: hypothetical protein ABIU29_12410, partial [Chthoniobacterales bacterium]
AHGLQLPVAPLRAPLDLTLEGSYSPRDIFFRTFSLANDRFSLGGFLMLGSNFIELQAMNLTLDGARRGSGTLFLPFSFQRWRATQSWLAALDEEQKFDVDLALDHLDLAQLGSALDEESLGSGILDGKLAAFGPLRALQVTTNWRLENVGTEASPKTIDFEGRLEGGRLEAGATARFGISSPVSAQASLPLCLTKKELDAGDWLDPAGPLAAKVECPALFLESLPAEWRIGNGRGLVTGNISWNGSFPAPAIRGEGEIMNATFQPSPPWPEVTALRAHFSFTDTAAVIDPLRCEIDSTPVDLRGKLTVGRGGFGLSLVPVANAIELFSQPPAQSSLSSVRLLGSGRVEGRPLLEEAFVRGKIWPTSFSLTIKEKPNSSDVSFGSETTYLSGAAGQPAGSLLLRVIPRERAEGMKLEGESQQLP